MKCVLYDVVRMKAMTTLVKSCPSRMAEYLPQILDPVWLALTQNAETYPFMSSICTLGSVNCLYLRKILLKFASV